MEPDANPVAESPAATPPGPQLRTRYQRRAAWLAGTLAAVGVIGCAAWLVNLVSTERALYAVASAPLPAAAVQPASGPANVPAPPEAAGVAGAASPGATPAGTPAPAAAALVEPRVTQPAPVPATVAQADEGAQAATPRTSASASASASAKVHKDGKRPLRHRVARRAPDSATFRRCPPLGQSGAVMCRWHICNGGAGKEAACRPYLERQP